LGLYKNIILIILILTISIIPRLWKLSVYPSVIVDEPANLRDIDQLIKQSSFRPFYFQWDFSQATLAYYPTIILINLFHLSDHFLALRLTSVIFSVLALIPFFLIIRKYTNLPIALCTTLLFSSSYYYLQFSRVGWSTIIALALGLYFIITMINALERKSILFFLISGALAGLSMYTYRGIQAYLLSGFLIILFSFIFLKKKINNKIVLFLSFLIMFAVISLPWLIRINANPDSYNLRLNVVSVNNAKKPYHGLNDINSIWKYQIITSLRSWIFLEPINGGGHEDERYLPAGYSPVNLIIKTLFWIGLIIGIIKVRKFWIWFLTYFFSLFLGQILTLDPPNGSRGLIMLPIIYLFSSLPVYILYKKCKHKKIFITIYLILSFAVVIGDINFYNFWMTWIKV
jgi:hypothetical protein